MKIRLFVVLCLFLVIFLKQAKAQLKDGAYEGNIIHNNVATRAVFNLYNSGKNEYTSVVQLYSLTSRKGERLGTVRLTGSIAKDGFIKFNNAVWTEVPLIKERSNGTLSVYHSSVERDYGFIRQVRLRELSPGTLEGLVDRTSFSLTVNPSLSEQFFKDLTKREAAFEAGPVSFVNARNDDERFIALLKWTSRYLKEFPDKKYGWADDSDLLFSDACFVPVFGKPYDELKPGEALKIYRRIAGKHNQNFDSPTSPYAHEFTSWHKDIFKRLEFDTYFRWNHYHDPLVQKLAIYRLLYADLKATMANTSDSKTLTLEQLEGYKKGLQKFNRLWPSDIQKANEVIAASEGLAAERSLKSLVASVLQSKNSYQSLRAAKAFSSEYSKLLSLSGKEFAENIQQQINGKVNAILAELMQDEKSQIAQLPSGENGIVAGNKWWQGFAGKYADFMNYDPVIQTKEQYFKSRIEILAAIKPGLDSKIEKTTNRSDLARLKNDYINDLPTHYELVRHLSSRIDARGNDIDRLERDRQQERKNEAERRERLAEANGPKIITEGLTYEKAIRSIWKGDFENVPFDRGSPEFAALLTVYIETYSSKRYCFSSLPDNRVEFTIEVEDAWETPVTVYRNRKYGFETGRVYGAPRATHSHTEKTGIFAKPELYNAKKALEIYQTVSFMGGGLESALDFFTKGNPLETMMEGYKNTMKTKNNLKSDIEALLRKNDCKSPGLLRFEQNLRLYALGEKPIRLEGL